MNQSLLAGDVSGVMPEALATGLFISRCTIQLPTQGEAGIGPSGAPLGTFANVTGLTNIRCMDAPQPPSEIKLGAFSQRTPMQVTDTAPHHVLLEGYYPVLLDQEWRYGARAVVTTRGRSETFEICGAETDSQRQMIRMEVKLVTAGAIQA